MIEKKTPSSKAGESQISIFKGELDKYEGRIAKLLAERYNIGAHEFIQSAVNAVTKNFKLLKCERGSLIGAILLSAELGLRFNTPQGHAFIYPASNSDEAVFQIGYKGYIEMAYRNPRVKSVYASVCYEKDAYEYEEGTFPKLTHIPNITEKNRGEILFSYAVVKLEGCDPITVVVDKNVLDKLDKLSGGSSYNSLDVHDSMRMKSAIKKVMKLLPTNSAPEISYAIESEDKITMGAKIRASESGDVKIIDKDPNDKNKKYDEQFG
jgi:recombination protein RecT